ncbi:MAG: glycosyltransferase family 4 protein [Xanthobacteraceae bacterium]|nr:glycosyltransferase family 4 protein [Xanthobacteraceae bacterium]
MAGLLDRLPFRRLLRRGPHILVLDDYPPDRAIGAGVPRAVEMLRALAAFGAKVTMWPLGPPMAVGRAEIHGASIVRGAGNVDRLRGYLQRHGPSFDAIIVSRPHNMRTFLSAVVRKPASPAGPPVFYDAEALYAERDIIRSEVMGAPLPADEARRMIDEELDLALNAQIVLTVNQKTASSFQAAGHQDVRVLGYAIEPQPTIPSFEQRNGFLFVGPTRIESEPNSDAVVWFADQVLPRLRGRLNSDVSLTVAGTTGARNVRMCAAKGLDIKGPIADLRDVYARARVFVAPTRFAAGIPLKVYDAAAHGVPAVVTPMLAESIGWTHERQALVAQTPDDFAAACHRLHEDKSLWERIRSAALAAITEECRPAHFDRVIADLLSTIGNNRR